MALAWADAAVNLFVNGLPTRSSSRVMRAPSSAPDALPATPGSGREDLDVTRELGRGGREPQLGFDYPAAQPIDFIPQLDSDGLEAGVGLVDASVQGFHFVPDPSQDLDLLVVASLARHGPKITRPGRASRRKLTRGGQRHQINDVRNSAAATMSSRPDGSGDPAAFAERWVVWTLTC